VGRGGVNVVAEIPDELIFQEPPAKDPVVTSCRRLLDHPGRWAVVASFNTKTTAHSKARTLTKTPPTMEGQWEFRAASDGDTSKLWAIYRATPPPPPAPPGPGGAARNGGSEEERRRAAAAAATD
jgi:hypothetical protein